MRAETFDSLDKYKTAWTNTRQLGQTQDSLDKYMIAWTNTRQLNRLFFFLQILPLFFFSLWIPH